MTTTRYYRYRSLALVRRAARRARKKSSRLLMVFLISASLVACAAPLPDSLVVPESTDARAAGIPMVTLDPQLTPEVFTRVQCVYQGEKIFDQVFDRVVPNPDDTLTAWIGAESVTITQTDCHAAH